jgi:pimeloyl-ACP methyl ester carboxylesterase
LFGLSSGAALALEAALALPGKIKRLAMYEPPYNDDPAGRQGWRQYRQELAQVLAAGRPDEALGVFMRLTGMPAEALAGMRQLALWPVWAAVAPTLAYDAAVMGDESSIPTGRASQLAAPTLILTGGASYPFMQTAAAALAEALRHGQHRSLEGQGHEVAVDVVAPVLVEFFHRPV